MKRFLALLSFAVPVVSLGVSCTISNDRLALGKTANALTAPSLGTSQTFAVLAGSTVTNTGATAIVGDLGVSPGTAVTGFPPGTQTGGTIHSADAVALQAQSDVTTAYNALGSEPCTANLTGTDLGGLTLIAGVYCFDSSAQLTGTLTLDGQGDPSAVFIFKTVSTLTTASTSRVMLINGATACNAFWKVGSSATIGTNTTFVGNILALTSIALQTGATVSGRTLARNGAVTLDDNRVAIATCTGADAGTDSGPDTAPADTGALVDSGTAIVDTGTAIIDTGTALDTGVAITDTGVVIVEDSGVIVEDSGVIDSGTVADTAEALDTGTASSDTGVSADSGAAADSGASRDAGAVADTGPEGTGEGEDLEEPFDYSDAKPQSPTNGSGNGDGNTDGGVSCSVTRAGTSSPSPASGLGLAALGLAVALVARRRR